MTKCSNCGSTVPPHRSHCECGNFVGFPNVRKAAADEEVDALKFRADAAWAAADAIGSTVALRAFADSVEADSKAIVCRDLGAVDAIVKSDNNFYVSYHRQVRAGARAPEDNKWDTIREQVDSALFPSYFENIFFALLSLNGRGDDNYGICFLALKDSMIRMRASVFEENSLVFADRHKLRLAEPIPPGFRAPWAERHTLAVCKLHDQVSAATTAEEFPAILFAPGSGGGAEFIEVHVHGGLGANSIESVSAVNPSSSEDRILWRSVQRRLKGLGIAVQER